MAVATTRDREAFVALFRHFAPQVKAYLLGHAMSNAVAEDLAQETLLTVWHKAAQFDPAKSGAATWVFTIARNLRIDRVRHESHPSVLQDSPVSAGDDYAEGDKHLERTERERLVAQALRELPTEQAEIIRLAFFEDRSHAEIERRLGIPLGTVKSRLRRAMRHLRLVLGDKA